MKNQVLTIAVAKGYLLKESIQLLKKINYIFDEEEINNSRKLYYFDTTKKIRLLNIRPWDVTTYVEQGAADLGIVGKDVLLEKEPDVLELFDLKFGKCDLILAALEDKVPFKFYNNLSVATKYPKSCDYFFKSIGIKANIVKMYGAIELAPLTGISNLICDLTATGQTLKENHLDIIETIFSSSARLIANPISFKTHFTFISSIIENIKHQF
ncbi:MAG: ATP phosphoribosyltransferase [Candidatus Margulisiibacteriota bacterium]|jgi:ATP phosphoribosyltransferase